MNAVLGQNSHRRANVSNRGHRLALEPLEGRVLLAAIAVDSADSDCAAPGDDMYCHLPEAIDAAAPGDTIVVQTRGPWARPGPPLGPPVSTEVGDNCLVDIRLPYELTGTLEATAIIDYRILAHGPCGHPPFTFDEELVGLVEFTGSVDGAEGAFKAIFTAEVRSRILTGKLAIGAGTGDLEGISGEVEVRIDANGPPAYIGQISINVQPLAGDANLDKQFDQNDIVQVLEAGKYNTGDPADFSQGDWNHDGVFNQFDIITALQTGAYLQGQ